LSETLQFNQGQKRLEQMNSKTDALAADEERMKRIAGQNAAITNTVILAFDLAMLFASAAIYQSSTGAEGAVLISSATIFKHSSLGFDGVLIPTLALMSSFGPAIALANLGSTLQNTFAAGNRVLDILDEVPVVEDITGREHVEFYGANAEHVGFAYGDEKILNDLSIQIPEHSIVGIVGRSGSGKSTLLKLFMRFWQVQQGSVKISHTDVGQINTVNLRDMESFMTQDTQLFHDSIRNNLRIAKLDASDEEIQAACKRASIHEFIVGLPQGYDTPVGELGDRLSGGERQRLGLARAFLHDAPFMLLDEPTSNLDSLNEAVILKSLKEESQGKTVVLVSHRQSTMRVADTVYSVENGRMS
jgi:ATP-binding cassette subfamily C protein